MTQQNKPCRHGRRGGTAWTHFRWVLQHVLLPITLALIAHWPNIPRG